MGNHGDPPQATTNQSMKSSRPRPDGEMREQIDRAEAAVCRRDWKTSTSHPQRARLGRELVVMSDDIDRTQFIGGSDTAAIIGVSPWKSAFQLCRRK